MMFNSLVAVLDGLFRKGAVFARTPKQGQDGNKKDKKATVKVYKEKHFLYNVPWSEFFFLLISVLVIVKGNVMNPAFYVTHLFYAASYLLMLYLMWFGGPSQEEEISSDTDNNSNSSSNIQQSDLEGGYEHDKKHATAHSTFYKTKGSSGSSIRLLMQFSFLLFLFYLGNSVVNRIPRIDGGLPSFYYLLSRENIPVTELKISSSCNQSDMPTFSEWRHDNFFVMECRNYPFMYKSSNEMKWSYYSQPVLMEHDEYIVARCGDKIQFHVRNQQNKTANQRALSLIQSMYDSSSVDVNQWMEQVEAQYLDSKRNSDYSHSSQVSGENSNDNKDKDGIIFKNINVLNLIIDGMTKDSFSLRKSRSLLEYKREMESTSIFNFKNFNIGGMGDVNEIAMTAGCFLVSKSSALSSSNEVYSYDRSSDSILMCDVNSKEYLSAEDSNNSPWIWNKYQQYGYVTLWGDEESHRKPASSSGIGNTYLHISDSSKEKELLLFLTR